MASLRNLESLSRDISSTAELAGVSADRNRIDTVIEAYADGFRDHAVELRTTTKSSDRRGLSFRFVDLVDTERDPYQVALDHGLLQAEDHPVHRLLGEVREHCELAGWGVDAEASFGLEKLWPFLKHGYPLEKLEEFESIPPSALAIAPTLAEHGMRHFSIIAADFRHRSSNLYFMLQDRSVAERGNLASLAEALGLRVDDSLLDYMSQGVAANVTLTWDQPGALRFCVYVPAPSPEAVPAAFAEPIPTLVREAPVAAEQRMFIMGPTFTDADPYVKIEIDWTGTTLGALQACMAATPLT